MDEMRQILEAMIVGPAGCIWMVFKAKRMNDTPEGGIESQPRALGLAAVQGVSVEENLIKKAG